MLGKAEVGTTAPTAASAWRRWLSAVSLLGFFACFPSASVGGGLALAPLQAIFGLLAAPAAAFWRILTRAWPVWAALALLAAWAGASTMWSSYAPPSLDESQALQIGLMFLFGLVFVSAADTVQGRPAELARGAVAGAVAVIAVMLLIEAFGDMAINRLGQPDAETGALLRNPGRGAAAMVVVTFAAIGMFLRAGGLRPNFVRAAAVLAGLCAFQFGMDANAIAFVAGGILMLIAYQAPRFALTALGVGLAAWILGAPFVIGFGLEQFGAAAQSLPLSWEMRVEIWRNALDGIWQAPIMGHGLDSARTVEGLGRIGDHVFPIMPLHPHNAVLHVWYELGAIGAALLAAVCAIGFGMAGRALANQRGAAAAAAGSFGALATLWSISYGAWQEWLIALSFAAAAIVLLARDDPNWRFGGRAG